MGGAKGAVGWEAGHGRVAVVAVRCLEPMGGIAVCGGTMTGMRRSMRTRSKFHGAALILSTASIPAVRAARARRGGRAWARRDVEGADDGAWGRGSLGEAESWWNGEWGDEVLEA